MDEQTYQRLRMEMLIRHRGELRALDAEWARASNGGGRRPGYGELLAAVRHAVAELEEPFTRRDVAAHHGVAVLGSQLSTISVVLQKLVDAGEVRVVTPRRGSRAGLYRRAKPA
jgi:hypothetical protein